MTGEVLAGEGEEGVLGVQAPAEAQLKQIHGDVRYVSRAVTGEILAGEGEEGVLGVQVPAEAQLKHIHRDLHDLLRAVTGEILAGEGEEGVLGVQIPAEAQAQPRRPGHQQGRIWRQICAQGFVSAD